MKKNAPDNHGFEQIIDIMNEMLKPLTSHRTLIPRRPAATVVAAAYVYPYNEEDDWSQWDFREPARSEWDEDGDYDDDYEEDYDCDDWEDVGDCPDYDPISEDNDRCLFFCPGCGSCMKKHLEEELV